MAKSFHLLLFAIGFSQLPSRWTQNCELYRSKIEKAVDRLPMDVCGENNSDRIIGGMKASIGQFPWMVRLGYTVDDCGPEIKFVCGGALITDTHVITAAHCVTELGDTFCQKNGQFSKTTLVNVRLGEHLIKTDPDCEDGYCADPVKDVNISKVYVHPFFDKPPLQNDIAVIKLKEPVKFTDTISPLCIIHGTQVRKSYINMTGIVAGWGIIDSFTGQTSSELQFLKVPILSTSRCIKGYKTLAKLSKHRQLCAGGKMGHDSCSGDSGGPLMLIDDTTGGPRFFLLGVVSFGFTKCAADPIPAVYTNAIYHTNWILRHLT